ncbi:MAG: hypothetical protein AB7O57_13800 [Hyphomicrobiaceae bacterium]
MPAVPIDQVRRTVAGMLHAHLPAGWGYRAKLSPRAEHLEAEAVLPNDISWLIWRPEDIGSAFRCYRLELVGTSGHEFVITHGNNDREAEQRPETATVFTTWTADMAFAAVVRGRGMYQPNVYGRS